MSSRKILSRLTLDLPSEYHRKLKTIAAFHDKSMREVALEAFERYLDDHGKHGCSSTLHSQANCRLAEENNLSE